MKKRPLSIWIISTVYMLIAPVGIAYMWHASNWSTHTLAANLRWDVLGVLVCGSFVGYGVFKVRPWGYFAFLGYSAALVLAFVYRHILDPTTFNYLSVIILVGSLGVVAGMIQRHFSAPYFNPQLRWWESDPRLKAQMNAKLLVDGEKTDCHVLDISQSGAFVASDETLIPGDILRFRLSLIDYDFAAEARVVRKSQALGGYGIMFLDMDRNRRKVIKSVLRYLSGQSSPKSSQNVAAPAA